MECRSTKKLGQMCHNAGLNFRSLTYGRKYTKLSKLYIFKNDELAREITGI